MSKQTELITVPTFTFNQGDIFSGTENAEKPIRVLFYNGTISLEQDGEYDQPESINILPEYVDALFKAIKKHKAEAEHFLSK